MGTKLSWQEISEKFDRQWVELIDFDWPEGKPFPVSGIVRVHAADRKEFYRLAKIDAPTDSAVLFIGKPQIPANTILCSSIMRLRDASCERLN